VKPLTEPEIRAAFVNCSKGEAKRAGIPRDLPGQPWEDLDFLGWRDPQSPERAYPAAETGGRLVAIVLRCPGPNLACSLYLRGKKAVRGLGSRPAEELTLEEQAERMMANLTAFIVKVTG
jgi:FBP C-terminal treble-clef zinc-finger